MITTKKEIESLDIKDSSYSRGCGKGLLVYIEPKQKGGGISFRGTMRIKKNGKQKQVTKTINNIWKNFWSEKEVRQERSHTSLGSTYSRDDQTFRSVERVKRK